MHLAVVEGRPEGDQQQQQGAGPVAESLPPTSPTQLQQAAQPHLATPGPPLLPRHASTPAEQEARFMEALQSALSMQPSTQSTPAAASSRPAAEVHQVAQLLLHYTAVSGGRVNVLGTAVCTPCLLPLWVHLCVPVWEAIVWQSSLRLAAWMCTAGCERREPAQAGPGR